MVNEILSKYNDKLIKYQLKVDSLKTKLKWISLFRLASFLAIFFSFYGFFEYSLAWSVITAAFFLFVFLFFIRLYISKTDSLNYYWQLVKINENEIKAMQGDYTMFECGTEYINKEHDYTYDLDIFGKGSLFQFLNRSAIHIGFKKLAESLQNVSSNIKILEARQQAIKEISEKLDWRQKFIAIGKLSDEKDNEIDKLDRWLAAEAFFKNSKNIKLTINLLSALTIVIIILATLKIIPGSVIGLTVVIQITFYSFFIKRINQFHIQISRYADILNNHSKLLFHIENENWKSALLNQLSKGLTGERISSIEIKKLSSLVGALDSRISPFIGFILNWILMWDFQCILRMEKWKEQNKLLIKPWFNVLSEIDALQSFGNYACNHPEYNMAGFNSGNFGLEAKELGHPLISGSERIHNDFSSVGYGKFSIITGANMAGKSTFLRTVGVNLVLALNGAPVCAKSLSLTPVGIFTSMRTDDSLQMNKSYFFSELERLKTIFDKISNNEKLFLILDEILKGTNSKDKEIGSKAFLKKLIKLNANGIIATHDLTLGELEQEFPDHITNQCFEVKISDKELDFDYKLYPGITKNLNASYLLKKMGIV